jgi:hypothetical protein
MRGAGPNRRKKRSCGDGQRIAPLTGDPQREEYRIFRMRSKVDRIDVPVSALMKSNGEMKEISAVQRQRYCTNPLLTN